MTQTLCAAFDKTLNTGLNDDGMRLFSAKTEKTVEMDLKLVDNPASVMYNNSILK